MLYWNELYKCYNKQKSLQQTEEKKKDARAEKQKEKPLNWNKMLVSPPMT